MGEEERDLLARITAQIERCSEYQHRMARRARVLREAGTMLRLGRPAPTVLALIQEQVPDAVRVIGAGSADEDWLRRQLEGLGQGDA